MRSSNKFQKKKKRSYNFLTRSSMAVKEAMLKLCRRMHEEEEFPSRFHETTLVQLYKQKGPMQQLSFHRIST